MVTTPFDHDPTIPDLHGLHDIVGPFCKRVVDEILDDLEHPHEDVLVLVGQEARGPVGEEMAAFVRDEHILHLEVGRTAPSPEYEEGRRAACGQDCGPR